jgi:uncharacterized protein YbjT (DUF2867 family)
VRILLTGATGMVGGHVLKLCLGRDDVRGVTTVGRRATGLGHDKLDEVVHADFDDFTPIAERFEGHDAAIYCAGVYTGSVPDDAFRRITVDHVVRFAAALHATNPRAVFCLLSGQGADPTEKSRMAFARYKGAAENALRAQGFARVHLFRPGYIYPVEPRQEPNLSYRVFRSLWPAIRAVAPNMGIASDQLARAMVIAAIDGTGEHADPVLENADIRRLAGVTS